MDREEDMVQSTGEGDLSLGEQSEDRAETMSGE